MSPDPWPLRDLVLRTPRLELRPDDDAGLLELVAEAEAGIHPPSEMPFREAWTDIPTDRFGRSILQFHWSQRAALRPEQWRLNFLVRREGRVIGTQGLAADDLAVLHTVATGSWLGARSQGQGYGTEMRAAVLMFAFDHLGARRARSAVVDGNPRSLAVSRRLGYLPDGTEEFVLRGDRSTEQRLLLTAERFQVSRPGWTTEVEGFAGCAAVLGVRTRRDHP
ncbi:RimJ/RimL family protein N-acetyltransferase [Actinoalloteichus hoggarensis]|uniref:Putative succinyl-CoA transferase n=1 Tax=Actinoalloteichus hoggarensis TaxID=1470176 RepID=A0A221VW90_9PSEU|nr:GNAT family N-acetyltransferase [Actinoalloteichus hoggarensis]ASO17819.1 Putative succinyl-CoA transferase [Actinoalloteichus hoggarensis]MBB5922946.1 RimJ/RimL family protein N-acetyltransferase [Actinoalloteichus hoggarensis]